MEGERQTEMEGDRQTDSELEILREREKYGPKVSALASGVDNSVDTR